MKLIVAGLSRTGTTSIHLACQELGLSSVHYDYSKIKWLTHPAKADFRSYDDIDVVSDLPTASFFLELSQAYPEAVVMLSHRPEDEWWSSVQRYFADKPTIEDLRSSKRLKLSFSAHGRDRLRRMNAQREIRKYAYGSVEPNEDLWRTAYRHHNDNVRTSIDPRMLVEFDPSAGDGWPELTAALGLKHVPETPFPHSNRSS